MKRILEYNTYDIFKDPENEKFLDKVKSENRDLYAKFLNIIKRKGLDVAKKEYEEYDPNYIKIRNQRQKEEKALRKKQSTKEFKEEHNKQILNSLKPELDEITKILFKSPLNSLARYIQHNERISEYLDSYKARKQYTNNMQKLLKEPYKISLYNLFKNEVNIDTLFFSAKYYNVWDSDRDQSKMIIRLDHFYNLETKKSTFSIYYNLFKEDDYYKTKIDNNKIDLFLTKRYEYAENHINCIKGDLKDIFESINKFSALLDEEIYKNWKKKYDFSIAKKKYNMK